MTADQFAYWLQGFTELHGEPPSPEQWASIKDHLSLVFKKVTAPVQQPDQQVRDLLARPLDPAWPHQPLNLDPIEAGPIRTTCSAGGVVDTSVRMIC
jgi:hypothetical protein